MKQIDLINSEINRDVDNIKLIKCVGAHNEEDWIEYVLKNNYEEFDKIRIVEGAVEGRPNSTSDGHSTDSTIEIIKSFPDPHNKIELYQIGRHFRSLEEQKQIFLDVANEDEILCIVDADEFYVDGDVDRIRRAAHIRPSAIEFIPTFLHFYRDFYHIKDFHPEWVLNHQRIIRYVRGMRYHTHPVATLPDGSCSYFSPEIQIQRYMIPVFIYHYGHAKGEKFHKMKQEFYRKELEKFPATGGGNAAKAFDAKFEEYVNGTESLDTILEFDGPHPRVMENHPLFCVKDPLYQNMGFKNWKTGSKYYSQHRSMPTIPQWMWSGGFGDVKMKPFYNWLDV